MNKFKKNKGITLVALIITIIVLLILAVVSIQAVTGDGIIAHAKNARSEYSSAQDNENATLDSYLAQLDDATKVKWTQDKTTVTNGEITLEVGDYVDYKANVEGYTDTNGWKVLGAENGELLLISSSNVVSILDLGSDGGYFNGISTLNTACEPYKNAEYATDARSVKLEDINRLTGYDPTNTGDGKPYGSGKVWEYGSKVRYSLVKNDSGEVTGVKYEYGYDEETQTYKESGTSTDTTFMKLGEWTNITEPYTVESTYYGYNPTELGISTSSNAYNTIFLDDWYWLASQYTYCYNGGVQWGLRNVANDKIGDVWFRDSSIDQGGGGVFYGVRCVVVLERSY